MFFRRWRRKRVLRNQLIPAADWQATVANLFLLNGLTADELLRLRQLATLFLHEKSLEPVEGFQLEAPMRFDLAAQAVLPILNLGINWYDNWTSLVLYPDEFATRHEWTDEAGVVHARREIRSGEAWQIGPVVLSWADVAASGNCEGYNAVIHEMAHKLDMSNGLMDGCPRWHSGMTATAWRNAFKPAYEDFCQRVDRGEELAWPGLLQQESPAVYTQLTAFYRQNPANRLKV